MPFVHLDCFSDYSLGDSVITIADLIAHAEQEPMPAVGLADKASMFGAVQLYQQARRSQVKPLVGMAADLAWEEQKSQRLLLYAANQEGYANLIQFATTLSLHPLEGYSAPTLARSHLEQRNAGLLVVCDGVGSRLAELLALGRLHHAIALVEYLVDLFGNRAYFSVQRIGHPDEASYSSAILELARLRQLTIVATNPARYVRRQDLEVVEIRYAIEHAQTFEKVHQAQRFYPGQYLRTSQEMEELFSDMPQVLLNSVEFAKRCNLTITTGKPLLPDLGGGQSAEQLRALVIEGMQQRLSEMGNAPDQATHDRYLQRLELELSIIQGMNFSSYFLIVHEFIAWARQQGITVGPGRGSVAGSLVAWCLRITEVDPLPFDLVFERFLNPERKSMPDIDIDFCIRRRDQVYQHVVERYTSEAVAQIITFGKLRPKAAIRDVARVLGYAYAVGDRVARLVPERPDMTFDLAFKESPELEELYQKDDEAQRIIEAAQKLEGIVRNLGKHAAGVVIAPGEITHYAPLYRDKSQALVTQYDKDDLDVIGLVKFDFLGLDTLTTLDQAKILIERLYNVPVDFQQLAFDDTKTYELLQAGDTVGVFQLESGGMRKHLRNLKPTRFDDIIAMLALYRPGPMEFIDEFIKRKHGEVDITYPHPELEEILANTYGIAIYQEQVMFIAQRLSGYTLAEADNLRRAMGKKKKEIMEAQRQIFVDKAQDKGVDREKAAEVFEFIERFASYGFNKSHSAAYAVLTYRTCWLKAHYPLAFYASMMSSSAAGSTRINILYKDCRKHGLTLLSPHVNASEMEFDVNDKDELVFGLLAIKGVGEPLACAIVQERALSPFASLFDLVQRIDRKLLTKSALEALVCAGAFDSMGMTRAELCANIEHALRYADQLRSNDRQGVGDLFGGVSNQQMVQLRQTNVSVWSTKEMLERERHVIGFYLSNHPYDNWRDECESLITHSLKRAQGLAPNARGTEVRLAGAVIDLRERPTKRGKEKLFSIEDGIHLIEARASESIRDYDQIQEGEVFLFMGRVKQDKFLSELCFEVETPLSVERAQCVLAKRARIRFARGATRGDTVAQLRSFLTNHLNPEGVRVCVELYKEGLITEIAMGDHWRLKLTPPLLEQFAEQCSFATLHLEC